MNTIVKQLEGVTVEPITRGRPLNKKTVRARNAVLRHLEKRAKDLPKKERFAAFTTGDIARGSKIPRDQAALALRWLEGQHGVVTSVGNAPRETGRGRPELIYILDRRKRLSAA